MMSETEASLAVDAQIVDRYQLVIVAIFYDLEETVHCEAIVQASSG